MLRTTKTIALMTILIFSVLVVTENDADAFFIFGRKKQTKPAQTKRVQQITPKAAQPIDKNTFNKKATAFLTDKRWKNGAVYGSSQRPKLSKYGSVGCCAYAADFVQYVFGKSSPRSGTEFRSLAQVRAGDILVLSGPPHWIVVLSRNGNILTTTEGNWMGKVAAVKGAYTINGNTLMRSGKKFRTFSLGYHYM